jgi:hypothetical protein
MVAPTSAAFVPYVSEQVGTPEGAKIRVGVEFAPVAAPQYLQGLFREYAQRLRAWPQLGRRLEVAARLPSVARVRS